LFTHLAPNRNLIRITSEGLDILLDPLQSYALISYSKVCISRVLVRTSVSMIERQRSGLGFGVCYQNVLTVQKAETAEAVVH
jgi:hypothetical protein